MTPTPQSQRSTAVDAANHSVAHYQAKADKVTDPERKAAYQASAAAYKASAVAYTTGTVVDHEKAYQAHDHAEIMHGKMLSARRDNPHNGGVKATHSREADGHTVVMTQHNSANPHKAAR